jgi:imidazolonepropionase-like amidohydrolase
VTGLGTRPVGYSVDNLLVDVLGAVQRHQVLLVDADGLVAGVVGEHDVPVDYPVRRIEAPWLMPGLIDLHVHLAWDASTRPLERMLGETTELLSIEALARAQQSAQAGVTVIRDLGGPRHVAGAVRDAIRAGVFAGPRVLAAGQAVCMTGGHGASMGMQADGPWNVRAAVRTLIADGADVIKVMATGGIYEQREDSHAVQLSEAELAAATEESHNAGLRVAAHAQGLTGIRHAIAAGVDTIEHGCFLDREAAEAAAAEGCVFVPTLVASLRYLDYGADADIAPEVIAKARAAAQATVRGIGYAQEAGLAIAAGTDAGGRGKEHGAVVAEIEALVEAGMPPVAALAAATSVAAQACGLSDEGTLMPGRRASFVAVSEDPRVHPATLRDVGAVAVAGEIVHEANSRPGTPSETDR